MNKHTKRIFKAKDLCRRKFPYLSALVFSMPCRPSAECETLAVDQCGRCYYSPAFIETLSIEQLAYCLLHECFHLALSHHRRRAVWCPEPAERDLVIWNIAADLCIQQSLAKDAGAWEPEGILDWRQYQALPGMRRGLTSEVYADLLREHLPQPEPPPFGGSCADGVPRPGDRPGEPMSLDAKLAQVAEAIAAQESREPGSTPKELRRAIDKRLGRQPDPFEVLKSLVARSVASPIGTDDYTYRRMSRRQPADCARMRGVVRLAPECVVVVDTSGSMSPYVQRAATAVAQGLRRVHRPRVVCFDAEAQSDRRLSSLAGFTWDGGGGTRMDAAIEHADTLKADCIVCITDGETDWPRRQTRARLVIAMVADNLRHYPPPAWARVVKCWEGGDYDA
jgi:predicted metal-dependent peptidase